MVSRFTEGETEAQRGQRGHGSHSRKPARLGVTARSGRGVVLSLRKRLGLRGGGGSEMPGGRGAGAAAGGPGRAGPAWTTGGRGPARGRAHRPGLAHCARLLGTLWSPPGGPGDPGQLETERSWAWVLGVGVPRKAGSASTQRFPRRVEAPRLPFRARLGGGAGGEGKFLEEDKVLGRWARLQSGSGSGVCSGPPRSGRQPQSGCPGGSAPLPGRGELGVGGRGGHPGSVSSA